MDKPRPMVELRERVVEEFGVDGFLDFINFLHHDFPVRGEDVGGEFAPGGGGGFIVICGEDTELVEEVSGVLIAATAVLEAAVVVEHVYHLDCDSVLLFEELQVGNFVAAEV